MMGGVEEDQRDRTSGADGLGLLKRRRTAPAGPSVELSMIRDVLGGLSAVSQGDGRGGAPCEAVREEPGSTAELSGPPWERAA